VSHKPPEDIATYLSTQGVATLGSDLFIGPLRPPSTAQGIETTACFVQGTGGGPASRIFGTATEIRWPTVQVRVRSTGFSTGYSLCQSVYDTLQSASIGSPAYMDVRAEQSGPIWIEQDENGHYHWALNFRCMYQTT